MGPVTLLVVMMVVALRRRRKTCLRLRRGKMVARRRTGARQPARDVCEAFRRSSLPRLWLLKAYPRCMKYLHFPQTDSEMDEICKRGSIGKSSYFPQTESCALRMRGGEEGGGTAANRKYLGCMRENGLACRREADAHSRIWGFGWNKSAHLCQTVLTPIPTAIFCIHHTLDNMILNACCSNQYIVKIGLDMY
ncbi:unnamed protein product [Ectocarpus sp. 12 AP-2014]